MLALRVERLKCQTSGEELSGSRGFWSLGIWGELERGWGGGSEEDLR
jgi:hypothetical protein